MAIRLVEKKILNAVQIISENDDALDLEKSNFEEYQKTGDVSHLVFVENKQPTIFLCNFELKGKEAASVKNAMLGAKDEEGKASVAFGSWSMRVAKYTLKDIKNPDYLEINQCIQMKKDKDGLVHDDLVADLDRYGIVNEIFAMYSNLVLVGPKGNAKN